MGRRYLNIVIHGWLIFMVSVGKYNYSIIYQSHGSYGILHQLENVSCVAKFCPILNYTKESWCFIPKPLKKSMHKSNVNHVSPKF